MWPETHRSPPRPLLISVGVALYLFLIVILPSSIGGVMLCLGGLFIAVAVLVLLARAF